MMGHTKNSLFEILTNSPLFGKIVNKVDQLAKLNRIVHQNLDPELKSYCRVANLRDGILIITTTSPAAGHLLRFAEIDLLSKLRAEPEWCHLKSVKTLVRPSIALVKAATAQNLPKPSLSLEGRKAIENVVQGIDSHELQKALTRLLSSR